MTRGFSAIGLHAPKTHHNVGSALRAAGYYDAGYTHDSAYAEKMAEKCADEFLGPNARLSGPNGPQRKEEDGQD